MLHEFLISHRQELIRRCRAKVAHRFAPAEIPEVVAEGVPLFIQQLTDALDHRPTVNDEGSDEGSDGGSDVHPDGWTPFPAEIGRAAALHGAVLLRQGFTVDQVVHDYGDVCQAITEMVIELKCSIDPDDFRIFNGCLDNAIAGAVTGFAQGQQEALDVREEERNEQLSVIEEEHRRLVEIAIQAFSAMRTGNLGTTGATGGLLMHALTELQSLPDQPPIAGDKAESASARARG